MGLPSRRSLDFPISIIHFVEPGNGLKPNSPFQKPDFQRIVYYVKSTRADHLMSLAAERLEIVMYEREGHYTNRAGFAIIQNFFEKHPVQSFKLLHTGGQSAAYLMGLYKDRHGRSFKIYIFLGLYEESWKINRLVIR